ncbi:extracellular solute-binding protein [Sinorhizobium meliloti]|nr:extracellular solute-binding protein [Sinorhizobium meliloti]
MSVTMTRHCRKPVARSMFKFPQTGATLESALLADGVPADKLYPLDVDRALKKIETIKDHIVWWTSGSQAIQFMTNGECDIGINWSARIANAINYDEAPLGVTWHQGLYNTAYWAIPKGAANLKAGQAAIAMWILDRKGQIDYVTRWPQPTDIKGLSLDDYPEKVKPYLPVGDNLKTAIREDAAYYEQNLPALIERFNAWLQQ